MGSFGSWVRDAARAGRCCLMGCLLLMTATVQAGENAGAWRVIPSIGAQEEGAPEYISKLPSIAGSVQGNFWLLDARGEQLMRLRGDTVDVADLWLPDGSNLVYASDLVVQDGWIYLAGTFRDEIYKVAEAELLTAWSRMPEGRIPDIRVQRLASADPRAREMRQHFLRSGLWLQGHSRHELFERARELSQEGWPVHVGEADTWSVRFSLSNAMHGRLCMELDVPASARGGSLRAAGTSTACVRLPSGWQVGAIYPIGLRAAKEPLRCEGLALSPKAQWLWMEVDLIGESAQSIETRTVLMRAAVDDARLRCWDRQGYAADVKSSASLMRVFALVGDEPRTLKIDSDLHWVQQTVRLSPDFWPRPLASFALSDAWQLAPQQQDALRERALPYAMQRWTLPQDDAAAKRYAKWQREGFFARCFPEIQSCGKPLAPRYLALGRVKDSYVGLPYGWGANDSPQSYVRRIAEGAYPGDINTNHVILKTIAGVDCSGFLTNVWQLPRRVVTTCRGGPDPWTPKPGDDGCVGAHASRVGWRRAQAGDVLLTPGHVRLIAQAGLQMDLAQAGRGFYMEIVESSGYCAGGCHRFLAIRDLGRYRTMRPTGKEVLGATRDVTHAAR